jgi:hypothetical protein
VEGDSVQCPQCKLWSPRSASRCDCGYRFESARLVTGPNSDETPASAQAASGVDEILTATMNQLARQALEELPALASKLHEAQAELLQRDYLDGGHMRDCYLEGATEIVSLLLRIRARVTTVHDGFPTTDAADESVIEQEARRRFESRGGDSDHIIECMRQIHTSLQRVLRALRIALNPIFVEEDPKISAESSREAFRALPHVVDEALFEIRVAGMLIDIAPFWKVQDDEGRTKETR